MAGQRQTPGFEITGLPEVTAKLNATIARMGVAGQAGVRVVAIQVINEAKQFCPVDSGRLRASLSSAPPDGVGTNGIRDDTDGKGPGVIVGTHVDYAPFVEFGTRNMSAQPYLRPALELARAGMEGEIRTVIRHSIPELA